MVHLLWTGGWDSTFRLCDLVLVRGVEVQPHYIIDPKRGSLAKELQTMQSIRAVIRNRSSDPGVLRPTLFTELGDISPQPEITSQYNNLYKLGHLGVQYEWLARYTLEYGLSGKIELGIQAGARMDAILGKHIETVTHYVKGAGPVYRLRADTPNKDMHFFRHYIFPIIRTPKLEMQRRAEDNGFDDIMETTWFCLAPPRPGVVCGMCNPCKTVDKTGMGRRVPPSARLRAAVGRVRLAIRPRSRMRALLQRRH